MPASVLCSAFAMQAQAGVNGMLPSQHKELRDLLAECRAAVDHASATADKIEVALAAIRPGGDPGKQREFERLDRGRLGETD
jgi:hypothetical protein